MENELYHLNEMPENDYSDDKVTNEINQIKKELLISLECNLLIMQLYILDSQSENEEYIKLPKEIARRILSVLETYQFME